MPVPANDQERRRIARELLGHRQFDSEVDSEDEYDSDDSWSIPGQSGDENEPAAREKDPEEDDDEESEDGEQRERPVQVVKSLGPCLTLVTVSDLNEEGPRQGISVAKPYFSGPKLECRVKEVQVSMTWRDQGWGDQKARVWLKLKRPEEPGTYDQKNDTVVAEMNSGYWPPAPHVEEQFCASLAPEDKVVALAEPGDYYDVMVCVGGAGKVYWAEPHRLIIRDFKLVIHGYIDVEANAPGSPER